MPDPDRILELFLRMLFDWDTPEADSLWKCIVTITPNPNDKHNPFTPNVAAGRIEDVIRCVGVKRKRRNTNVYVNMSTLREVREGEFDNDGFPRISRKKAGNAVTIKSLYVDVDVGKNGCYQTTADAELGLRKFLTDSSMPDPSMQVYSGSGGFHVYWCFDKPLTMAEWQPLADALKAMAKHHGFLIDMAITADGVRILRVPTTFNHKQQPPTECQLNMSSSFNLYTKDQLATALAKFISAKAHTASASGPQVKGQTTPLSGTAQNFTAGVGETAKPVPIDDVAGVCPMTADLLARAGAGVGDPLWKLSLLLATFTTDPKDAAHRMSSGWSDPQSGKTYDPAETDKALQDKLNARAANPKLGWPSCAQFHAHHAACNTCPFLQQGKTPFHFVAKGPQPATPKSVNDPLMPEGYWRNVNDHVFTKTSEGAPIDVTGYAILDGGISEDNNQLVVKFAVGGRPYWGEVDLSPAQPSKCAEAWTRGTDNRIVVRGANHKMLRDFTVSWVHHLQAANIKQRVDGFGWHGTDFVFDNVRYTPTGQQSVYRGKKILPHVEQKGELAPWQSALRLVRGNVPLEIMVVSTFAAPLVELSGWNSTILSLYSSESGHGKSTAMFIAQAAWGHPILAMLILDDTENAAMEKLSDLRHLPAYWDEIKTTGQIEKLVKIVFATTQGKKKQRLTADIKYANVGAFRTMFSIASNLSLSGKVIRATPGSDAGGVRVFEIEATQPIDNVISIEESNRIKQPLETNYGCAGAVYAEYLVANRDACIATLKRIAEHLETSLNFDKRERIWLGTMTTLAAGAYIAKTIGLIDFDVDRILDYLKQRFVEIRNDQQAQSYSMLGSAADADDVLAPMLSDLRGVHMVQTATIGRTGAGRPTQISGTGYPGDPDRLKDVWLQEGLQDGRILARITPFNKWLDDHDMPVDLARKLIEKKYRVTTVKMTVGAGLPWLTQRQAHCYLLDPFKKPVPPDDQRS